MDTKTGSHFADIIALAQHRLEQITYAIDTTPERAILRLQGQYGAYQILVTELFGDGMRKYQYYVLKDDWVEAGFDNTPDPRAIRLKYSKIGRNHAGEHVPHLHRNNKIELSLTEDVTFEMFVEWLQINLRSQC